VDLRKNNFNYYFIYSGLFISLFLIIYSIFWIEGKSFVYALYGDGHICFNSLVYYGEWLRTILRTGEIPSFDLSVGYGSDLFLTLSWETLGDPLNLLAVFFDADHMEYLYDFLAFFRIYLAGITFSVYARYHFGTAGTCDKPDSTILAGSLIYVFSGFVLFAGVRDVYFMTPVIFFPLMISGIDRILRENKPLLLILSAALAAIANYYYFYMLTVFTVLYAFLAYFAGVAVSMLPKEEHPADRKGCIHSFLRAFIRCAGAYFIGTMIACVQLVPIVIYLSESSRSQQQYYIPLLYSLEFYAKVFSGYISSVSNTAWTHLGFAPVMLPAVLILFLRRKKEYRTYRIAFCTCAIFLSIPMIGSILNGMTYPVNRWIWVFALLNACIFISVEEDLFSLGKREYIAVASACLVYSAICLIVPQLRTRQMKWMVVILAGSVAAVGLVCKRQNPESQRPYPATASRVGLGLVIIGVTTNGLFRFAPWGSNYAAGFVDAGKAWSLVDDNLATDLVRGQENLDTVRVDALGDTLPMCNTGMNHGINGTDFYFSLANGNITRFMDDLGVNVEMEHRYSGLDGRTILERLFGVRYCVSDEGNMAFVPYGYKEDENIHASENNSGFKCYTCNSALPLGYGYDSILSQSDFESLDVVKRQEAILQCAVVSDRDYASLSDALPEGKPVYDDQETSFNIIGQSDGIEISGKDITVSRENAQIILSIEGMKDSENYLVFERPEYDLGKPSESGLAQIDFTVNGSTRQMKLYSVTHPYNHGREEYIINLGYNEQDAELTVTVTFHNRGIYRMSDIRAVCQPMTRIDELTKERQRTELDDIQRGTDTFSGTVRADRDTLLCISVPYSQGWSVYLDGEKTDAVKTQDMFLGILVPEGTHSVRLEYRTPGQRTGGIISIAGLLLLAAALFMQHHTKKAVRRGNR
jgi:uncharacterized membrane protein YfhO